jgi:hypothetical protein
MRLYVSDGPTAASESTGIDKGEITRRAKANGLSTVVIASTRAATLAIVEQRRLEFEQVTLGMVRLEQKMLALASSTHNVFVGQAGTTAYVAEQWEPHTAPPTLQLRRFRLRVAGGRCGPGCVLPGASWTA